MITSTERIGRTGLVMMAVLIGAVPACGQDPIRPGNSSVEGVPRDATTDVTTPAAKSIIASDPESRSPLDSLLPTEIRYLPDSTGKLHPIPDNATLQGYLEYLSKPRNGERETVPLASVSSIEMMGEANEERVKLNARITVQVRQTTNWVRVPLYLNEAVLVERHYTGAGDVSFEKDPDKGLVYWVRGANPHVLDLTLMVRVRPQLPTRKLQFTLPSSPICRLKLVVPHRSITARAADKTEEIPVEVTPLDNDRSQIEVFGLGNRVDISWQPNPDSTQFETALEANTTILAQVDSDAVLLDVHQRVQSLQGKFDSFAVLLPQGAEVLKIEDDQTTARESRIEGYRERRIDPGRPNRVIVTLSGPSTGPVRLRWTVRLPRPDKRKLTLDGFIVESARKQSGEVGLAPHEGLRLSTIQHKDANVLKINALELKADIGGAQVTRAYRFLNQPFSLIVGVDPIEPNYTVEPKIFLTGAAHQLTIDAVFDYQVTSESLSEVTIVWPDAKSEGWVIEGFDPSHVVQSFSEEPSGSFRVRLIKPQTSQFQVRLRAKRPTKGNDDSTFTLPRAKASNQPRSPAPAAMLAVLNAENVETELTTRGETAIRPVAPGGTEQLSIPDPLRVLKSAAIYRIDTDEQAFALRVIPQPRRLKTESSSDAVLASGGIWVTQKITYNVSYERMAQVKLLAPRSIEPIKFTEIRSGADRGIDLNAEWTEGADPQMRQFRVVLPDKKIGAFDVQARFFIRLNEDAAIDGETPLQIPILQSIDEPFAQTRFALTRDIRFEPTALSDQWKPKPLSPDAWTWQSDGPKTEFSLRLARSAGKANGTASVSRGLITALIEQDGRTMVRAQFRISARSSSLLVELPLESESPRFHWDQTILPVGSAAVEAPQGSKKYSLHLPISDKNSTTTTGDQRAGKMVGSNETTERLLTIDYQLPNAIQRGLPRTVELQAPQLPQCSWDAAIIWQTSLPQNQHLFTHPASATPMFRWRRSGFIWYRVSDPESSRLDSWMVVSSGPGSDWPVVLDSPNFPGNLYTFSQFGAPRNLKFHTMTSPMVVLFGAGISFLFGFILLRVRALRHVLTVLTAGLVLAAVGLWNSAPLELLMQPMIAGLLFPLVAVLIEGWFRRSYRATILTLPTAAELAAAHGSRSGEAIPTPVDQSTTMRPPKTDGSEALHVEAGSGV